MTAIFTSLFETINGSFPPCPELSGGSGGEQLWNNRCWDMCKLGSFGGLRLADGDVALRTDRFVRQGTYECEGNDSAPLLW